MIIDSTLLGQRVAILRAVARICAGVSELRPDRELAWRTRAALAFAHLHITELTARVTRVHPQWFTERVGHWLDTFGAHVHSREDCRELAQLCTLVADALSLAFPHVMPAAATSERGVHVC